jgi:hypothetical protein
MKVPTDLTNAPNVASDYSYKKKSKEVKTTDTQTEKPKEPVIVINSNSKKEKKEKPNLKELKNKVPRKLRKSKFEPTEEQKLRMFRNYVVPKLEEFNVENPNNDLVKSIKEAFGKDNKEKLNEPLPTFSYNNEAVRQKMANDLFDTETKLADNRELVQEQLKNSASTKLQSVFKGHKVRYDMDIIRKQFDRTIGLTAATDKYMALNTKEDGGVGYERTPVKRAVKKIEKGLLRESFRTIQENNRASKEKENIIQGRMRTRQAQGALSQFKENRSVGRPSSVRVKRDRKEAVSRQMNFESPSI